MSAMAAGLVLGSVQEGVVLENVSRCDTPASVYHLYDNGDWNAAKGIYRFYRDGFHSGHVVYSGNIVKAIKGSRKIIPVHREVFFESTLKGNTVRSVQTTSARRLGDRSEDKDVLEFIFPALTAGSVSTSYLYLIDGSVLAYGTETMPRFMCRT
ncbi:hypothetical protein C1N60_02555 [Pantoea sp. SGAir0184]